MLQCCSNITFCNNLTLCGKYATVENVGRHVRGPLETHDHPAGSKKHLRPTGSGGEFSSGSQTSTNMSMIEFVGHLNFVPGTTAEEVFNSAVTV